MALQRFLNGHHKSDSPQEQLSRQIAHLSREVGEFTHAVGAFGAKTGSELGAQAGELAQQLRQHGEQLAHALGRQARKAGAAVKQDPVPAVVAVIGFALLLNLLLGRRR